MSKIEYLNTQMDTPARIVMLTPTRESDFPDHFHSIYHTHLLCHKGHLSFSFNGTKMTCRPGEFLFWFANSNLKDLEFSKGFRGTVLLVEDQFLFENLPDQSWSSNATIHSRQFPILKLKDQMDRQRVLSNFRLLNHKYLDHGHKFYEESLMLQMRLFFLEMWHTFSNEFETKKSSSLMGSLFERFILLVQEHCTVEREVQFYANLLHITPKHLNFICKQNSGTTASEWIQRFTKERIILFLQNDNMSLARIAEEMEFSSPSFFTRYVKKVMGITPTAYRRRLH